MEISIQKAEVLKVKPDPSTLGFGKVFTDHMFIMDYSKDTGWTNARIVPFGNLSIHPASTVLHYGAEIFEGLKAYRRADGGIQLFRPLENIRRMRDIMLTRLYKDVVLYIARNKGIGAQIYGIPQVTAATTRADGNL